MEGGVFQVLRRLEHHENGRLQGGKILFPLKQLIQNMLCWFSGDFQPQKQGFLPCEGRDPMGLSVHISQVKILRLHLGEQAFHSHLPKRNGHGLLFSLFEGKYSHIGQLVAVFLPVHRENPVDARPQSQGELPVLNAIRLSPQTQTIEPVLLKTIQRVVFPVTEFQRTVLPQGQAAGHFSGIPRSCESALTVILHPAVKAAEPGRNSQAAVKVHAEHFLGMPAAHTAFQATFPGGDQILVLLLRQGDHPAVHQRRKTGGIPFHSLSGSLIQAGSQSLPAGP